MTGPFWVGGEDSEYVQMGGGSVSTSSGRFRSAYARCALAASLGQAHESILPYSKAAYWFTARVNSTITAAAFDGAIALSFLDGSLVERIRVVGNGGFTFRVEKVDSLGAATPIGNTFYWPISGASGILDKIDVHIVNDPTGSIDIYINGIHAHAFVGDTTTDGVTTLCRHRLGCASFVSAWYWSETICSDDDTRSKSLAGFNPVANGNTHNFDTGSPAAANVNEITLDDTTLDGSSSAGQKDQYTVGVIPSGTLDVIAQFISVRAQKGASGPSKLALGVRTNGTDYWGSDQSLDTAWTNYQEAFLNNPDTGVPWLRSEIGSATGFNIGAKSAA